MPPSLRTVGPRLMEEEPVVPAPHLEDRGVGGSQLHQFVQLSRTMQGGNDHGKICAGATCPRPEPSTRPWGAALELRTTVVHRPRCRAVG